MATDPDTTTDHLQTEGDAKREKVVGDTEVPHGKAVPDLDKKEKWRAYVATYKDQATFPPEIGDIVWIVEPRHRGPRGKFKIIKALANNKYELESFPSGVALSETVDGAYLSSNPYAGPSH